MLQRMGLQRAGRDLVTEQQQQGHKEELLPKPGRNEEIRG